MSKYIDYDAIDYRNDKMHDKSSDFIDGVVYMAQRIEEAPSIDIVRCKECKHHKVYRSKNGEFYRWCRPNIKRVKDDDFCSYGERREP